MKPIIDTIFSFLDSAFNKIPFMKKLDGYRAVIGLFGMAVISVLSKQHIGDASTLNAINDGLLLWTGLSLNSNGRPTP